MERPEYKREKCFVSVAHDNRTFNLNRAKAVGSEWGQDPPCPLELLPVFQKMAGGGDLEVVYEAFKNRYLLLGAQHSVHEINQGYSSVSVLFDVA